MCGLSSQSTTMKAEEALIVALVAICSLLACRTAPKVGQPAPDFTLADSTGFVVKLSAFKRKVVLLDFWATCCEGCTVEIPWYVEFQKKYGNNGLAAIGVSMDAAGWKSVEPFLQRTELSSRDWRPQLSQPIRRTPFAPYDLTH